jgi:hypothetical protein
LKKDILKRFDDYCGVVKVLDDRTKEFVYVVYGFFFTEKPESGELGDALGKGKTVEEALIDAIRNSVQIRRETENAIHDFMNNANIKLYSPAGMKEKIIHPMLLPNYNNEEEREGNATFYLNEKKKTIYMASL